VKKMPKAWMTSDPCTFARIHRDSNENPWMDVAIMRHLSFQSCPFGSELVGVFMDQSFSYVVSSLASGGDLLSWLSDFSGEGKAREAVLQSVIVQLMAAVQKLHDLGIAHRDISLENVLIHEDGSGRQVKLIDYGMATVSRHCPAGEERGKLPYQAPEMHVAGVGYDSFLADTFALGVLTFSVIFGAYPWESTTDGGCWRFKAASKAGIKEWLNMVANSADSSAQCAHTISDGCKDLLAGALAHDPDQRMTLGERCWEPSRPSVLHCSWLWKSLEECSSERPSVASTCDTLSLP